jgi:hypothetical protein
MNTKRLTEDEAILLMSIAVDFGVTQVVDGNGGDPRGFEEESVRRGERVRG